MGAARAHLESCDRVVGRTCKKCYENALSEARAHVQTAGLAVFHLVANFFFENDERTNCVNCVRRHVVFHERHCALKRSNEVDGRIVRTLLVEDGSHFKNRQTKKISNKFAIVKTHHPVLLALEHLAIKFDDLVHAHQERGFSALRVLHKQLRRAANDTYYMYA